jgi:FPC/CPF motif-containing protein YcgG
MPSLVDENSAAERSEELFAVVRDERFPCLGAKSAMARGMLRTLVCSSIQSGRDDFRIHCSLLEWVRMYRADNAGLRSLAVVFEEPLALTDSEFERALWERLQSLAERDHVLGEACAAGVSVDPENPTFALSFGGAAFFVVGLHPNASRPGRRAPRPTLVFNLHDQFERLRADGIYDRMRAKIIERDVALAGSANPMLGRFGEASGAPQYSGRAVGEDWRCPFQDPRARREHV